jgi:hypothetical protein
MLIQILGAIDIISGLILGLGIGIKMPSALLIMFGAILLIKSIALGQLKDFGSWIDFCGAIILSLSLLFQIPGIICLIAGALIIQKGISSFL